MPTFTEDGVLVFFEEEIAAFKKKFSKDVLEPYVQGILNALKGESIHQVFLQLHLFSKLFKENIDGLMFDARLFTNIIKEIGASDLFFKYVSDIDQTVIQKACAVKQLLINDLRPLVANQEGDFRENPRNIFFSNLYRSWMAFSALTDIDKFVFAEEDKPASSLMVSSMCSSISGQIENKNYSNQCLDSLGVQYFGVNLVGANFSKASLKESGLLNANLSEANLSEANLSEANLSGAVFSYSKSKLEKSTNFSRANLSHVIADNFKCEFKNVLLEINSEQFVKEFLQKYCASKKADFFAWNAKFDKKLKQCATIGEQALTIFQHAQEVPTGRTANILNTMLEERVMRRLWVQLEKQADFSESDKDKSPESVVIPIKIESPVLPLIKTTISDVSTKQEKVTKVSVQYQFKDQNKNDKTLRYEIPNTVEFVTSFLKNHAVSRRADFFAWNSAFVKKLEENGTDTVLQTLEIFKHAEKNPNSRTAKVLKIMFKLNFKYLLEEQIKDENRVPTPAAVKPDVVPFCRAPSTGGDSGSMGVSSDSGQGDLPSALSI